VTPYRPSVSTPAALSAPGWLEVEAGVQSSKAVDPVRRESLPYTLKLALTPDWGVRIGGDALVHQREADGSVLRGGGDTTIVLKHRLLYVVVLLLGGLVVVSGLSIWKPVQFAGLTDCSVASTRRARFTSLR
jgi:hypothetical protein